MNAPVQELENTTNTSAQLRGENNNTAQKQAEPTTEQAPIVGNRFGGNPQPNIPQNAQPNTSLAPESLSSPLSKEPMSETDAAEASQSAAASFVRQAQALFEPMFDRFKSSTGLFAEGETAAAQATDKSPFAKTLSDSKISDNKATLADEQSYPISTGVGAATVGAVATAAGAVVAGPVGAVVGAVVGGSAGGWAGHQFAADNAALNTYTPSSLGSAPQEVAQAQPATFRHEAPNADQHLLRTQGNLPSPTTPFQTPQSTLGAGTVSTSSSITPPPLDNSSERLVQTNKSMGAQSSMAQHHTSDVAMTAQAREETASAPQHSQIQQDQEYDLVPHDTMKGPMAPSSDLSTQKTIEKQNNKRQEENWANEGGARIDRQENE